METGGKKKRRIESPEPDDDMTDAPNAEWPDGLEPDPKAVIDMDEWEERVHRRITGADVAEVSKHAVWCLVSLDGVDNRAWTDETEVQMGRFTI